MKMSIRPLAYQYKSVFKRYCSNQHFSEVFPQDGGENQPERNYVTVTLCRPTSGLLHKCKNVFGVVKSFFLKFYLLATFFILKNCQIYAACNCLKFNKSNFENRQRGVFFSESVNVNCHTIGHCVREDGRQSAMAMSFS